MLAWCNNFYVYRIIWFSSNNMIQKEIILNIIVCYIFLWDEITGVSGASDKKLNLEGKFEYTQ